MSRRFGWWVLACVVAFASALGPAGDVRGGLFELHVRTDGNDSLCNGTKDRPADQAPDCAFRTLGAAVAAALPNVIVTIGPGTFSTGQVEFNQAITVRGQAGSRPTLVAESGPVWLTCDAGVACKFENVAFDGDNQASVTSGMWIEGTGTLKDVTFSRFDGTALVIEGQADVSGSTFEDLHKAVFIGSAVVSTVSHSVLSNVDVGISVNAGRATASFNRFVQARRAVEVVEGDLQSASQVSLVGNDMQDVEQYLFSDAPFASIFGAGNRLSGRLQFGTQQTASFAMSSNWWRCDTGPDYTGSTSCAQLPYSTPANWFGQSPWIVMAAHAPQYARGPADVIVDMTHRSDGTGTAANLPDGIEAMFSVPAAKGSIPATAALVDGVSRATFIPGPADGIAIVTVRLDETQATVPIFVDRKAPTTSIVAPVHKRALKRLSRVAVAAADPAPRSDVAGVDVAIRRKVGKVCSAWNGATWMTRPCGAKLWRPTLRSAGGRWVVALPQGAGDVAGTYTIFSRARDRAGNVSAPGFTPGTNQVTVTVAP